ncbi:ParB/RepB/Spo0J family partition protein [Catenulispora rubra]|uniref:ParB/RepB/Spo0J family partition protein n=1 Tax=Catenulispora rubra TaxID=280293 RepID=UPI0018928250|nr:ParB/RepB/Spo0J family partition protein [Catenulispora rubra]
MSVSTITKQLIEDVDPKTLILTKNVRPNGLDEGFVLDEEFVSSIREHGVLQPVIAAPYEGGMAVLFGNRRTAGAIAAGRTIDVVLRDDLTGEAARIITQLVENMHRQDMRPTEIAAAYVQLALDLGMSEEDIAKKVSRDRGEVRAAIALHSMPKAARDAVDNQTLELDIVVELQEFETDSKVYQRLLDSIEQGRNIQYAILDERRKKKARAEKAQIAAGLKEAGIVVIPHPKALGYGSKEIRIDRITDADGKPVTVEEHESCPGHVACIDGAYEPKAIYLCCDPKAYGHAFTGYYTHKTAQEEAEEQQERQRKAEEREALSVAAEVRAEFIVGLCQSKAVPKGAMRFALQTLFANGVPEAQTRQALVLGYLGAREAGGDPESTFGKKLTRIAEARQPLVLLAHVAATMETNLRTILGSRLMPYGVQMGISWLEFLAKQGYKLTEPETALLERLRQHVAEWEAEEEEGDDDDFEDVAEDAQDADEPDDGEQPPADPQESPVDQPAEADAEDDETDRDAHDSQAHEEDEDEEADELEDRQGQDDQADADQWEAVYPELADPVTAGV